MNSRATLTEVKVPPPAPSHDVTLSELLLRGGDKRLPVKAAIDMVHQVAEGCAQSWALGKEPVSIEPDTIHLSPSGRVRLEAKELTAPGKFSIRRRYLAPETKSGGGRTEMCDVYSLSAILYEMLTGTSVLTAVLHSPLATAVPPPSTMNPEIPPELDKIILDGVQFDLVLRTPSLRGFMTQLESLFSSGANERQVLKTFFQTLFPEYGQFEATPSHLRIVQPIEEKEEATVLSEAIQVPPSEPMVQTQMHTQPAVTSHQIEISLFARMQKSVLPTIIALRQHLQNRLPSRRARMVAAGMSVGFLVGMALLILTMGSAEVDMEGSASVTSFVNRPKLLNTELTLQPMEPLKLSEGSPDTSESKRERKASARRKKMASRHLPRW